MSLWIFTSATCSSPKVSAMTRSVSSATSTRVFSSGICRPKVSRPRTTDWAELTASRRAPRPARGGREERGPPPVLGVADPRDRGVFLDALAQAGLPRLHDLPGDALADLHLDVAARGVTLHEAAAHRDAKHLPLTI